MRILAILLAVVACSSPDSVASFGQPLTTVLVGDTTQYSSTDNNTAGSAEAWRFTAVASGTLNSLSLCVSSGNVASQIRLGIYSSNSGGTLPTSLLTSGTISAPVSGWNAISVSPVSVINGKRYWLALLGPTGGGTPIFCGAASGTTSRTTTATNLSALPAIFPSGGHTWSPTTAGFFGAAVAGSGGAGGAGGVSSGGSAGAGGTASGGVSSGGASSGGASSGGATGGSPATGTIVGFGVNGQPRNWGMNGAAVKPALDMLVNDLGANFFRVEISGGQSSWETSNDDADPGHFEWSSYDPIFQSKPFTDLFDYVRYLNTLGVPEITLSAHGPTASWMGGFAVNAAHEDEYIETILAVLVYARTRAPDPKPAFTLVSPWNEPDLGSPEGVRIDPPQGARLLGKLVTRMNSLPELDGIAIQAPDVSIEPVSAQWRNAITDPTTLARIRGVAFHRYGGYPPSGVTDWTGASPAQWLTEFNDWAGYCYTANWTNAMNLIGNLLSALEYGSLAGIVWTDYDAPHSHDADNWETFGLLHTGFTANDSLCGDYPTQLDQFIYTPKPTYYAARHIFRYIARGATRVGVTNSDNADYDIVGFKNPNGSTAVVGVNTGAANTVTIQIGGSPPPSSVTPYISTSGSYFQQDASVMLTNGSGSFSFPGNSAFTLVGN